MSRQTGTTLTSHSIWRRWAVAGSLLLVAAASVISVNAWAEGPQGGAPGHHGMKCHMSPPHMGMMPFGGRHLARMLDEVKATDAQRQQIKVITQAAEKDQAAQHESAQALHAQTLALLAQPTIDTAAAEKLRQQMVTSHDARSKQMLKVTLDIAQVLTPEQRAQLAAKMKQRHEKLGHSHRGE